MATANDQNVFSSSWKDSDIVLVVEDQEIHVHKWILASQSPVFKAMFDEECLLDKITLKDTDFMLMVQFLKLLYPWSMVGEDKAVSDDKNLFLVLALAEKYECVNLIQQCINKVKITPESALQILPYAVKYHHQVLPALYDVINWGASTSQLETLLPRVENKETSDTMLLTKCRFLETSVVKMQDAMMSLISDFLTQRMKLDRTKRSLDRAKGFIEESKKRNKKYLSSSHCHGPSPSDTTLKTKADSRCCHSIGVREIKGTKKCLNCKEKYKEKFLAPILNAGGSKSTQNYFKMLETGDDVASAAKQQK